MLKNISAAAAGAIAPGATINSAVATPIAKVVKRLIVVSIFDCYVLAISAAAWAASVAITCNENRRFGAQGRTAELIDKTG
jgi:hypothetical protein